MIARWRKEYEGKEVPITILPLLKKAAFNAACVSCILMLHEPTHPVTQTALVPVWDIGYPHEDYLFPTRHLAPCSIYEIRSLCQILPHTKTLCLTQ